MGPGQPPRGACKAPWLPSAAACPAAMGRAQSKAQLVTAAPSVGCLSPTRVLVAVPAPPGGCREKKGYSGVTTYVSEAYAPLSCEADCLGGGGGDDDLDREGRWTSGGGGCRGG